MTPENLPDLVNMTMEEMDEWVAIEEAKTPFTSFDLSTDDGRQGLLRKYYMIGDTSLFEAVSHVWGSLIEPKAAYCTLMGLAAGTGGMGKRGLVLALHKFLAEALDSINAIPSPRDFQSLDQWHHASMHSYVKDEEDLCALLHHYSSVLNGGEVASKSRPFEAIVLQGPWQPVG
jgi:hypothetical protein